MTGMDLARLREVAEAATEGPWAWEAVSDNDNGWCLGVVWDENDQPLSGRVEAGEGDVVDQVCELMFASHFRDAEHIATFDPPTVLALLDALASRDVLLSEQGAAIARVEALADEVADLIGDEPHMDHGGGNGLNVEYCPRCWIDGIRAALRSDPDEASADA